MILEEYFCKQDKQIKVIFVAVVWKFCVYSIFNEYLLFLTDGLVELICILFDLFSALPPGI
jgi:hypothetical protein